MANTPTPIPGDTDDLDAFSSLLVGKAVEPKEEVDTTAEQEAETEVDETEDNAETSDATDEVDEVDEEAAEEGDPGENEEGSKPEKGKKNRFQERIDELTAAKKTADREAEEQRQRNVALERRLQELESKQSQRQEPNQEAKAATAVAPSPDDKNADGTDKYPLGEIDPNFTRDLVVFSIKQENEAERIRSEERTKAEQVRQAQVQLDQEWTERVTKVEATLPNYRDTVKTMLGTFESVDPAYGNYLAATIKSMEHGPEVLYFLSNNLPEARKIVESGAVKATIALGRLEAQFSQQSAAAEKKPVKKVTKAAEPPKIVRGNGGKFAIAADTDDLDAFEKAFLAKK